MRYRALGGTGIEVSEIAFGSWGIGRQMWVGPEDARSLRALHTAADLGLNFIDTALVYGRGHAERLIGRFLAERSERIYVASKIPPKNGGWPARGRLEEAFPRTHIRRSTELSLENLGVERIDLMQLHVWHPGWLEEPCWHESLSELKEEGKIAHFGVSLNDHDPASGLALVASGKTETIQVIYNIFDQGPEDALFPLCLEQGVGVIARVPFDEGGLAGAVRPDTRFPRKDWRRRYFAGERRRQVFERVQGLQELLGEEAASLPELALKFCLHHPAVSCVAAGMSSPDHVRANLGVCRQAPLSAPMLERLRAHRWTRNFYPSV